MSERTEIVKYVWNTYDAILAQLGACTSPYKIPASLLNQPETWETRKTVELPLGFSAEPGTVARFYRDGYEWIDIPEGVEAPTIMALFTQLFALDKVKFAHLDPLLVLASAAAADVDKVKAMKGNSMSTSGGDSALSAAHAIMTAPSYIDPTMIPFADLAFLHFEYWGNSALRAEVFQEMFVRVVPPSNWDFGLAGILSPRFPLMFPWGGIFGSILAMLVPQAIPTSKNGKKLEKVLARKPLKGVPIRSSATQKGKPEKKVTVISLQPPHIELDGWTTQTLAPIWLNEWKTKSSKIRFRLTLPVSALKTVIEIVQGNAVIYSETHDLGEFIIPGVHLWYWDGYDQDGIFDTAVLRSNDLAARLTITDMSGRVRTATTELGTGPGSIRWTDLRIDQQSKIAEVTVHSRFSNPSDVELAHVKIPLPEGTGKAITGMLDPIANQQGFNLLPMIPGMSSIPEQSGVPLANLTNNDQLALSLPIPSSFDLDKARFDLYKQDIIYGIGFHWSRRVTIDGHAWSLVTSCRERSTDCVRTFLAEPAPTALKKLGIGDGSSFSKDAPGERSFNAAAFMEGLPIVDIWDKKDTQRTRRYVGAHELGHSVLREAYDPVYSICHKGSSTFMQAPSMAAPLGPAEGESGEIDVMFYFQNKAGNAVGVPESEYLRVRACEDDARALIWMCKVVFG